MSNFERLLQKAYERKTAEAEKEQKRQTAYKALNVPEGEAKKYLGKEEYAEFVDSIPRAIDAYLTEGKYYAMDGRARPYLVWVARIKNLRREEEAKSVAIRQTSRFNKELNQVIEKLKQQLHPEKQNASRYFKEKRPISQKLYSCLSQEQRQYIFQKVEDIAQDELKTLVLEPYREFLKWENRHYYRLSPKADYVFDGVRCLAFSFGIEAVVESEIRLTPGSKILGGYSFNFPKIDRGSHWTELQWPVGLGFYYQYFSCAELPAIAWQTIPLTLVMGLMSSDLEPTGTTILEASEASITYSIKDFEGAVNIPEVFAGYLKTIGTINEMASVGVLTRKVASILQKELEQLGTNQDSAPSEEAKRSGYDNADLLASLAGLGIPTKEVEAVLPFIPKGLGLKEAVKVALKRLSEIAAQNTHKAA